MVTRNGCVFCLNILPKSYLKRKGKWKIVKDIFWNKY